MKIAVIRNDHLGDLLLTTPLVRALSLGGHRVTLIAPAPFCRILEGNPHIESLVNMEDIAPLFPKTWMKLGLFLRQGKFEAVLLPYAKPKQLLWASWMSGAPLKIALWGGWWGMVTGHRCIRSKILEEPRPYAQIVMKLAFELGLKAESFQPEIFLDPLEIREARNMLDTRLGKANVVCIHPGSAGSACNLQPLEYSHVAREVLSRTDLNVVVTGSAKEARLIDSWPEDLKKSERIWYSFGQLDIRKFAAIISQASVVVCPSTGALHVATAFGVKTVSPFCSRTGLSAKVWGNQDGRSVALEANKAECDKCFRRTKAHCDFRGEINGDGLSMQVFKFLPNQSQLGT